MLKRMRLFLVVGLLILTTVVNAQVTTSSMGGRVYSDGEPIIGATIVAIHEPSGTRYGTITNVEGRFTIQGMRVGGPYMVEISYIGYQTAIYKEIQLQLGEMYSLDVDIKESSELLDEVVVLGTRSKFGRERNGSMTNVSTGEMNKIPTMNRSLSDYTKLSPYSSGTGSFGGRPAYATNITVDGANFNNNFGLNANSMPGPSASSGDPISMDAVEEMQIAVAPYDVRQSNFTGAGVNVITKSGTNDFHGSAYMYFRNQDFNGTKIRDNKLTQNDSQREVYGFTVGGPIVKNKLFFFVSGELENNTTPGNTLLAKAPGRDTDDLNVSANVEASDLQYFSNFLDSKFGYKTGRYEKWGGDNEGSRKLLAKIDWNISNNHKATFRYNFSRSESTSRPSSSGDATPTISGGRHARNGGMSFENSQYRAAGVLHSVTGELNSKFTDNISNNLLVAYTSYNQPRETDSSLFPFIDIMNGTFNEVYMSAGLELFSYENEVKNNTLIITDNLITHLGNHTITAGLSYENQYLANSYLRQGSGYYRFKDMASFERYINGEGVGMPYNTDYHPLNFAYTYPINGNKNSLAELTFGQFAAYIQDEWNVNNRFKLTYGLRIDLPVYWSGTVDNPVLKEYSFRNGEKVDLANWPKTRVMWSPRVGFNYDVTESKSIKLRGGVGLFTGRIPFVWFVNQPQNSGMINYQLVINQGDGKDSQDQLARIPFEPNTSNLLQDATLNDIFPQENAVGGKIASIDKNFKLPQVLRTSLAADFRLPYDFSLTLEGIFTKDVNSIYFDNINLADASSTLIEGNKERPYWSNSSSDTKYITSPYENVVVMRNTSKGYSYSLSAQLNSPVFYGLSGTVGYTYTRAEEVTGKNGSDPFSAWQYRHVTSSLNSKEMGFAMNNMPNRVIAAANYTIDYAKHFRSTFSLFYEGHTGGAVSYIYSNDANKDGTVNDLMYIPKSKDDVIWASDADADAYFAYAAKDPYLTKNAGKYAKRYAAYEPFYHRLDFRFLQDFYIKAGKTTHTLQVSLDILNLPNLLSSNWGVNKIYIGSNSQVTPLKLEGRDEATGKAIVSMNEAHKEGSFQDPSTVSSTWRMQLGVRYIF